MKACSIRRQVLRWLYLPALLAALPFALAHEVKPPPKYGGYVLEADEIFFEVVVKSDRMLLYVEEDGKALDTQDAAGSLSFASEGQIRTFKLRPAGFNLLHAEMPRVARGVPISFKVAVNSQPEIRFTYVMR